MIVESISTANITVSIKPSWLVNLADQRVKVGESLLYSPGIQLNTYGFFMHVSADLGDAFRFSEYDKDFNIYRVNGLLMSD
jgi:hypothetical protein